MGAPTFIKAGLPLWDVRRLDLRATVRPKLLSHELADRAY